MQQQGGGGFPPRGHGPDKKRLVMADARKSYTNNWTTPLTTAPCSNPTYCLYAACCAQCAAYSQRKEIMFNDLTNYTCCNGDMCISGRVGEKSCPEFCLCCEVCCCFPSAVATSRFMIQDEQRVENTKCDNFIIGFMLCLNQLACLFRIAAMISGNDEIQQIADILDCIADITYCTVCACMQTQQRQQLKQRDPNARPPSSNNPMAPPPPMQMMHQQMPPQHQQGNPQYGQPQQGYAQPPPQYGQPQQRY
uniref:Uncharacterized protein n=1 Tax=Mantoniella antarctica TaxID=81844 RepID=A0A7S0SH71_9CHLO|mmetsp:Transcript_24136/g.59877  ORF Transcript_24136/g.59877 Transcript_24136/m.59877 type:complete len:250 (+) Transcript_24136:154-903(+)